MNEELQNALLGVINSATSFVGEQAPAVIQELLMWKMVYNIVWLPLDLLIGYSAYRVFRKVYALGKSGENWAREYNSLSGFGFAALLVSGLFMVVGPIAALDSAETIVKILVAPKVYLIEYAASLAK